MWTIITAVVVVLVVAYKYMTDYNFFEKAGIPHLKAGFGNAWKILSMPISFAEMVRDLYNLNSDAKYIGFYEFFTPILALRDLDLIKSVTIKNFDVFPDRRSFQADDIEPLFGKNLFNLQGDRWREVRATLSPAFTSSKMKTMFVLMNECAKKYGQILSNLSADQRVLELKDAFTRYTNDVIATCAFGVTVDSMTDRQNKFYVYGREATTFGKVKSLKLFLARGFPRLFKFFGMSIVEPVIVEFFKDVVSSTIKTRDEKGIVRPDMIQLMMETRGKMGPGKELTIEDMTAQAFVFFFGGFESTSTTMCFATYEVGVNPDVQRRLHEEIDQVLEDCNGDVTYEAINNMKYLDAITNEALRMYPIAVFADRVCMKDFELPPALPSGQPHIIRKGEYIWIPIYGIQRDPEHFPEPEKFNPDRFYDDPKKILNSGAFLGFGQGPRMCIGNRFAILETKTLLFHVFANCELKPCSKTPIPMKLSRNGFNMNAEGGFWFEVLPRKKAQHVLVNSVTSNGVAY